MEEDDEVTLNKKRTREEKEAEVRVSWWMYDVMWCDVDNVDNSLCDVFLSYCRFCILTCQKSRGNYRCSKCNVPKKGHVCPYQPRFRRRDHVIEGGERERVKLNPIYIFITSYILSNTTPVCKSPCIQPHKTLKSNVKWMRIWLSGHYRLSCKAFSRVIWPLSTLAVPLAQNLRTLSTVSPESKHHKSGQHSFFWP